MCMCIPGQPVADLESYMTSMEKKQESIEKMMQKLEPSSDPAAKKFFDCKWYVASVCAHLRYSMCMYACIHLNYKPWAYVGLNTNAQMHVYCLYIILQHGFPIAVIEYAVIYIFHLRLHDALQPVLNELKDSYNTFSTYITELKMEHKDGKVASAELSALLVWNIDSLRLTQWAFGFKGTLVSNIPSQNKLWFGPLVMWYNRKEIDACMSFNHYILHQTMQALGSWYLGLWPPWMVAMIMMTILKNGFKSWSHTTGRRHAIACTECGRINICTNPLNRHSLIALARPASLDHQI